MKTLSEVKQKIANNSVDKELRIIEKQAFIIHKIIRKREELGWTQQTLAEKSKIKQSAIARIENSTIIPRIDTLLKLIIALNMEIDLK